MTKQRVIISYLDVPLSLETRAAIWKPPPPPPPPPHTPPVQEILALLKSISGCAALRPEQLRQCEFIASNLTQPAQKHSTPQRVAAG